MYRNAPGICGGHCAPALQGQRLQEKIGEICLQAGDVLLLDTGEHEGHRLCGLKA